MSVDGAPGSTFTGWKDPTMRYASMGLRRFDLDCPHTYMARLTNRQWRLIVSALTESGNPESEQLARDLLKYVLPLNVKDCNKG